MPSRYDRVTISLPHELLQRVEAARGERTRSEAVASLLTRALRDLERAEREAAYDRAFRAQPETEEELDTADAAAAEAWADAGDEWREWAPKVPAKRPGARKVPAAKKTTARKTAAARKLADETGKAWGIRAAAHKGLGRKTAAKKKPGKVRHGSR